MRLNRIDFNLDLDRSNVRQILQELEFYLTLTQFVTDLLQSMKSVKENNTFFAEEVEYKIQQFQVERNINLLIEKTLIYDSFQADLQTLENGKKFMESKVKKLFSHVMDMLRGQIHSWLGDFKDNMTKKIQHNCSYRQQSSDLKTFTLRKYNMLTYLKCIYCYLVQKHNEGNLYNRLKEITDRWIGQTYNQLIQRRLHLLYKKSQTKKQLNQGLVLMENQNDEEVQKVKMNQSNKREKENYFKLTYPQLQVYISHLRKKVYSYQLVNAVFLPQEDLDLLCCLRFIYDFSLLESNEFKTSRNLENVIVLEKNTEFQMYENSVKEASSALLNSYGGYILIGLQKVGINYKYHKSEQVSMSMMKYRKEVLTQWATQPINRGLISKDKSQTFDNLIKVDCIPVFNTGMQEKNPSISKIGQYIYRIRILFDRNVMMVGHHTSERFYDIVKQRQTYVRLKQINGVNNVSSNDSLVKDKIYRKLRSLTDDYGCLIFEEKEGKGKDSLSRLNQLKRSLHHGQCLAPHDGQPAKQKINQQTSINEANRALEIQKAPIQPKAKQQYQNQEKQDFKHINLIVLQTKTIKQNCEAYFRQKKIAFKIQKLDTSLKKLSKQTYVIQHHKKYEQINAYLNEFKKQKQYNVNKKIILISAEKGICVQDKLSSKDLEQVITMLDREHKKLGKQVVYYVEDTKEKRSYFKTETKLTGIYLYFILSEMNIKSKMKNVPANLVNGAYDISKAIMRKKENEAKRIEPKGRYQNTGNYHDNSYENNQNQYNVVPNQYNPNQYIVVPNKYNQNQYDMNQYNVNQYNGNQQYIEEEAKIYYQWKVFFTNTFYQYFVPQYPNDICTAISQFVQYVDTNINYKEAFWKCIDFYRDGDFYISQ